MSKKIITSVVAIFVISFFSLIAKAEDKESAYTQLGGIYNIAQLLTTWSTTFIETLH